jgi:hypothetical protein
MTHNRQNDQVSFCDTTSDKMTRENKTASYTKKTKQNKIKIFIPPLGSGKDGIAFH